MAAQVLLDKWAARGCDPNTPVAWESESWHEGGVNVLFEDGSVEHFKPATHVLNALVARPAGE